MAEITEVVVSPKGHIGKSGWASSLRHFLTGAVSAAAIPLIKTLAPVVDALGNGEWGPLLALKPSSLVAIALSGIAGGALAGILRLAQRRRAELKIEVPNGNRQGV